jgi:hypothetical protein
MYKMHSFALLFKNAQFSYKKNCYIFKSHDSAFHLEKFAMNIMEDLLYRTSVP